MSKRVAILGGGVGGLSAAHELVERGFDVDVYEQRDVPGGKARSIPVPGTGTPTTEPLPGEHGFRFFPGFYKHLPDTMKRIPFAGQPQGVFGNLVQAREYLIAESPTKDLHFLVKFPSDTADLKELIASFFHARDLGIPPAEIAYFAERILLLLTSCPERRATQYEKIDWWSFIDAENKSEAYQRYCAIGLTRSLVAMRAEIASTRTVGDILIQLLLDVYDPLVEFDRVLAGPTTEMWLSPWRDYLESRGVRFHFQHTIDSIALTGDRVASVRVTKPGAPPFDIVADCYVAALPVERFAELVTPQMIAVDPLLGTLVSLRVAWMNGLQIYLKSDAPLNQGHVLFSTSPWALTGISQEQFWRRPITQYGDGSVKGVFSIDISNWEAPGVVFGQPAKDLTTADAVFTEVRKQVQMALDPASAAAFDDANIAHWFLDQDIVYPTGIGAPVNREPLLINTAGSWECRPDAQTLVKNLFLAADYVKTHTDLATMEGANEAARRATNAILAATGSDAPPCRLWPLHEPEIFAPARELDRLRFERGELQIGMSAEDLSRMDSDMRLRHHEALRGAPAPTPPRVPSPARLTIAVGDLLRLQLGLLGR